MNSPIDHTASATFYTEREEDAQDLPQQAGAGPCKRMEIGSMRGVR